MQSTRCVVRSGRSSAMTETNLPPAGVRVMSKCEPFEPTKSVRPGGSHGYVRLAETGLFNAQTGRSSSTRQDARHTSPFLDSMLPGRDRTDLCAVPVQPVRGSGVDPRRPRL